MTPSPRACPTRTRSRIHRAFTLIEVLVVVAIIALLVAILLPALKSARNQAKVMHDAANLKQISTMSATYQSEQNSYVPIVFNDATIYAGINAPARTMWVSVALRQYSQQTSKLGARTIKGVTYNFDPNRTWDVATRDAYEANILPEVYVCPFQRDLGPRRHVVTTRGPYRIYEKLGRADNIQTWLSENVVSGVLPSHGVPWPTASGNSRDGLPKYTAFSWNCVASSGKFKDGTPVPTMANAQPFGSDASKKTYRKWSSGDVRRLRSGSMSLSSVAYCAQGENVLGDQGKLAGWANPGSHARSGTGGTNVTFADSHVEWVPGKQVGWP